MALLHFEGFEAYSSSTQHNEQSNTATTGTVTTSVARTGSRALELSGYYRKNVTVSGSTIIVGLGWYWGQAAFFTATNLIRLVSSSTGRGALALNVDSLGRIRVGSSASGSITQSNAAPSTILWTNTDTDPVDTWLHYELKVVLSSTTSGSWSLKRNGALLQSQSSVQTLQNGSDVIDLVVSESQSGINDYYMDDIYICDGSGSDNNDFLGPVRVAALRPTSDASVAMTPSSGSNYQCVDDTTPNDDTDYVSAPPSGLPLVDRYGLGDLPAEASLVRGVRTIYRARKEDAALVEMSSVIESGGTTLAGTTRALDTSYTYYTDLYPTDPDTSAAWTPAGVDAMTAGVRRTT